MLHDLRGHMQHIFHVGYHKTGTTWLQKRVFPTAEGAVSVHSHPVIRPLVASLAGDEHYMPTTLRTALDEIGGRALVSYEALVGNPWGNGPSPQQRAERLARVVPDAKIILTVRAPDDLRLSLYAQYINEGGYLRRPSFEEQVLSDEYLDAEAAMARWRSLFEDVLVVSYERLRSQPEATVDEIADFADIGLHVPPPGRRDNPSLSGWRLWLLKKWNRLFRRSALNPDPWLPVPRAHLMRRALQRSMLR